MNDSHLLNTALVSLLIGSGSYSALRGLQDLSGASKPKPLDNELEITLPSSRVPPKEKFAEDPNVGLTLLENASKYALPILAGGAGLYGGFKGTSGLYDYFANKEIDNDKEKVKADYLKALQHANTKVGSISTPNVDAMIGGVMDKLAGLGDVFDHAGKSLWAAGGETAKSGWEGIKSLGHKGLNEVAGSDPVGLTAGVAALLALGSGGATYYLANRMDQNKEENSRKTNIPTEVRLNIK